MLLVAHLGSSATDVAAVGSAVVAAVALWQSSLAKVASSRLDGTYRTYDGYGVLSELRITYWEQAHLLELSSNYADAVADLKVALGRISQTRRAQLRLRERAVATRVFSLYEEVWIQVVHAREARDRKRARLLVEVRDYLVEELMLNPRLQYLWREDGGNLRVYIRSDARDHFEHWMSLHTVGPDARGPYG